MNSFTMTDRLYVDPDALPPLDSFSRRSRDESVLFTTPTHFSVDYRINPYMVSGVDNSTADQQWRELVSSYEDLADVSIMDVDAVWDDFSEVEVAPPGELPDITFCSNHALSLPDRDGFLLAQMATDERHDEPAYFEQWCDNRNIPTEQLHVDVPFEGCGDARWHPGRRLLWGGYGPRTDLAAYREIADRYDVGVVPLELTDDSYYHLDVCFSAIDEHTAVVCPDAFTDAGREKLDKLFETLIEVSPEAAQDHFACNCHSLSGDIVVIEESNHQTIQALESRGYDTLHVSTDEFMKAGGSVACMAFPY
ncbi:arginine deiminase-related protein [Halorubrum sp. RMP-47]|uniref:dimethylarginine dimethylaminohydrolase family protein n=1 Tax=Halorubrum miltondacostae TaxID=3076378 RepID=UPI0035272ADD